jgi:hypothetical protein
MNISKYESDSFENAFYWLFNESSINYGGAGHDKIEYWS